MEVAAPHPIKSRLLVIPWVPNALCPWDISDTRKKLAGIVRIAVSINRPETGPSRIIFLARPCRANKGPENAVTASLLGGDSIERLPIYGQKAP